MSTGEEIQISVIIPAYNVEKYLPECLDSIVRQTFSEWEVIIVNDGSIDTTQTIIDEYVSRYPERISAHYQENAGQSAARNAALAYVRGKYMTYIDADDYILDDYLETLYRTAEKHQSELVICSYDKFENTGEIVLHRNSKDWEIDFGNHLSHVFQYSPCAKLYLSRMIIDNHILFSEGEKMEDGPYGIIVNSIAKNPVVIEYFGYKYRKYDDSTMGGIREKGISKNDEKQQFPYKGIEGAIQKVRELRDDYDKVLEFVIMKALAGFAFSFSRRSGKETQKYICEYTDYIMKTYFPEYLKNPYIGLFRLKKLPLSHRGAVWLMKWACRFHVYYPVVRLYTVVANLFAGGKA